jgi:hypothetical protein
MISLNTLCVRDKVLVSCTTEETVSLDRTDPLEEGDGLSMKSKKAREEVVELVRLQSGM